MLGPDALSEARGGGTPDENVHAKRQVALLEGFFQIGNPAALGGICEHDHIQIGFGTRLSLGAGAIQPNGGVRQMLIEQIQNECALRLGDVDPSAHFQFRPLMVR